MEITGDMAELKLDNGKAENFNDEPDVANKEFDYTSATKEDDHEGSQNVEKKILVIKEDEHSFAASLADASGSTSNIVATSQDPEVPQIGEVDHPLCLECKDDVQESNVVDSTESVQEDDHDVVVGEERRIGHYTNKQKILLVGEGDFSFASCLADAFLSASNLVATSLDSRSLIVSEYSKGEKHLQNLEERGAVVIHQVDVNMMNAIYQLKDKYFDRIVFNFPHCGDSGFRVNECDSWHIEINKEVVISFFKAAKNMVTEDGEIHVTHKTAYPYSEWKIVELAMDHGLVLKREVSFDRWMYPGYENKKAYGSNWDNTFPVGKASTFMFCRS